MLTFLIILVLLQDGSPWQIELPFYSAEDCQAEGEMFDIFMATHSNLWLSYHAQCEAEPGEGAFNKREA